MNVVNPRSSTQVSLTGALRSGRLNEFIAYYELETGWSIDPQDMLRIYACTLEQYCSPKSRVFHAQRVIAASLYLRQLKRFTLRAFFERYPNEETCLGTLFQVRGEGRCRFCRKCRKQATFHRIATRSAYACARCGAQVFPRAGTMYERSSTPLLITFFAQFVFHATEQVVTGRELQRILGVTYKTAWRMLDSIKRSEMASREVRSGWRAIDIDQFAPLRAESLLAAYEGLSFQKLQ